MKKRITEQERERLVREHRSWLIMIAEQSIYGVIVGILLAWLVILYDINRIGSMIANSENRIGFIVLIMFGFGTTFGMVAAGAAIWFRAELSDED